MDEAERAFWITRYSKYQEERQKLGDQFSI